ncbi:MAG: hypothetical protein HYZ47_02780 [Simkania negevensis]|nr:hypothetical protein [Simkania negevensis]
MSSVSEINPSSAVQLVDATFNSAENVTEKNKTNEIAQQETQSPEQRIKGHKEAQARLAAIAKHTVPVTLPKASVIAPTKSDHVTLKPIKWDKEIKDPKKAIKFLRERGYSLFVDQHLNKKSVKRVWLNLSEGFVMLDKDGRYRIYNLITGHCLAEHKQRHVAINQALPKINELKRVEAAKKAEEARKAKETAEKAEAAKKAQQDALKVKEEAAKAEAAKKAEEARKAKETHDALKATEKAAKAEAAKKDKEVRKAEETLATSEIAEGVVKTKERIKQAKQNPQQEVQETITSENTQRSEVVAEQPKKPTEKDGKGPDGVPETSLASDSSRL